MGLFKKSKYTCKECGGRMKPVDDVLICTVCGYWVEAEDYGFENEYDEYFSSINSPIDVPEGCVACGGPYPHCQTSCKLFDD